MALTQRSSWMNDDLDAFRELAHAFCQKELAPNHERWAAAKQVDRELAATYCPFPFNYAIRTADDVGTDH